MTTELLDTVVSSNSQELSNASSAIKLFENPLFKIRVIMRCAEPWFVAKDACDCLEIVNASQACQTLDEDEKGIYKVYTLGGSQDMMLISESGLYTLVMRSNKPEAKVFRKWVTSEVLPSIRKTGGYSVAQPTIFDYARALIAEKERSDALEAQNKALTAERDEAIRTKYHFVEGRDAKVCGELGGLRTQNEALRKQIGDAKTYKAVTAITWLPDYFNMSNRGLYGSLAANLKKIEAGMTSEFKHIDIPDSRFGKVKAYHVDVIGRLHEMVQADENLMAKYRKIASV